MKSVIIEIHIELCEKRKQLLDSFSEFCRTKEGVELISYEADKALRFKVLDNEFELSGETKPLAHLICFKTYKIIDGKAIDLFRLTRFVLGKELAMDNFKDWYWKFIMDYLIDRFNCHGE